MDQVKLPAFRVDRVALRIHPIPIPPYHPLNFADDRLPQPEPKDRVTWPNVQELDGPLVLHPIEHFLFIHTSILPKEDPFRGPLRD